MLHAVQQLALTDGRFSVFLGVYCGAMGHLRKRIARQTLLAISLVTWVLVPQSQFESGLPIEGGPGPASLPGGHPARLPEWEKPRA